MLSVCIPHFNFQNPILFQSLHNQCLKANIEFEILIIDDASETVNKYYLQKFEVPNFRIIYLQKNIGRSAIRNLLAKEAKYGILLFLDGDSKVISETFIQNYLNNLDADITSGGRTYQIERPENQYFLHWNYGINVEIKSDFSFHSNNFIVKKKVFEDVKFDESLSKYGYEDVVFGLEAKKQGFAFKNIENCVEHIQLKTNGDFLNDVEAAIKNLQKLIIEKPKLKISESVSLSRKYQELKKLGLNKMLSYFNDKVLKILRNKLIKAEGGNTNFWLTVYKIHYYHKMLAEDSV